MNESAPPFEHWARAVEGAANDFSLAHLRDELMAVASWLSSTDRIREVEELAALRWCEENADCIRFQLDPEVYDGGTVGVTLDEIAGPGATATSLVEAVRRAQRLT